MPRKNWWLYVVSAVAITIIMVGFISSKSERGKQMSDGNDVTKTSLRLSSPVFKEGEMIPAAYTCKGQNINPPLNIAGVPAGAKSLALIVHDPDAVSGDFVHWTMWDIPTDTATIAVNSAPANAIQGINDGSKNGYMGPCPPAGTGTHRYMFELYALDKTLGLSPATNRDQLQKAMAGHIVGQTTLTGLFSAE